MRDDTRIDWHRRVDEALIRLLDNLDDPPRYSQLAKEVSASPYWFHKQFTHLTGESFKACADRLRLEKAASMLRSSGATVTEIAFECGYTTVEMLSKAVRKVWGLSPTRLRQSRSWHPYVGSKAGIHYAGKNERKSWFYVQGGEEMETKIVRFDDKRFYGYRCVGDYWQLPGLWERFHAASGERGLGRFGTEYISVFPDADEKIPMDEKRALAGFVTAAPLENAYDLEELVIPAGLYAVTVHFGSSEAIGPVWDRWMKEWLPGSGWEPDYSRPNYEWYQNRHDNPELLLTFLVTSVKRKE